jgi:drug/metabolite transporter (DMT)-like permease
MDWILIAIAAYFLIALQTILDKFLLTSNRVAEPATYAFYVGLMSAFTFILFPFGLHGIDLVQLAGYILSGAVFLYGVFCLFTAIEKNAASRVMPLVGAIIPITTLILSVFFLGEGISLAEIGGIFLLIFGGFFISLEFFKKRLEPRKLFSGFKMTALAGLLIAISFTAFKYFYRQDNFFNVFIWTRLGLVFGAVSLLSFPLYRKNILASFKNLNHPKTENKKTGLIFIVNKILGGVGSALTHLAVSMGSVAAVNALASMEYVFVFILGLMLSFKFPVIFQEEKTARNVLQKTLGICIIMAGVALITME